MRRVAGFASGAGLARLRHGRGSTGSADLGVHHSIAHPALDSLFPHPVEPCFVAVNTGQDVLLQSLSFRACAVRARLRREQGDAAVDRPRWPHGTRLPSECSSQSRRRKMNRWRCVFVVKCCLQYTCIGENPQRYRDFEGATLGVIRGGLKWGAGNSRLPPGARKPGPPRKFASGNTSVLLP
jgi:hypothetical protein